MHELLPWQQSQWTLLMRRKTAGRLPHALLCSGPAGLGKRAFAERFAQTLLCNQPSSEGDPCGRCRGCRLFIAGSHPDYVAVEPTGEGKVISVEAIRKLCGVLSHTSQLGGYKMAMLTPAEQMNINAANSLLKTLEEPPELSLLLLVTAVPSKLPATIRSRCQLLRFHQPPLEEATAWLATRAGDADPQLLLSLAGGAPVAALDYMSQDRLERRQGLFHGFKQVVAGKADPVRTAEDWLKGEVMENLRWLIEWHMDMIRLKIADAPPRLFNPDLQTALYRLAQGVSTQTLFRRLDAVIRVNELRTTQVNVQIMIEDFLSECAAGQNH